MNALWFVLWFVIMMAGAVILFVALKNNRKKATLAPNPMQFEAEVPDEPTTIPVFTPFEQSVQEVLEQAGRRLTSRQVKRLLRKGGITTSLSTTNVAATLRRLSRNHHTVVEHRPRKGTARHRRNRTTYRAA